VYVLVEPVEDGVHLAGWRFASLEARGHNTGEMVRWARKYLLGLQVGGRQPELTPEQKRLVLRHIVQAATLLQTEHPADAADILDEWCQKPQPIDIDGHSLCLPSPVTDDACTGRTNRQRRENRLNDWLRDIFGHARWTEIRDEL